MPKYAGFACLNSACFSAESAKRMSSFRQPDIPHVADRSSHNRSPNNAPSFAQSDCSRPPIANDVCRDWDILVDIEEDRLSGRRSSEEGREYPSRRMCRAIVSFVFVVVGLLAVDAAPRSVQRVKLDPNYLRAMVAYRKLEPRMSQKELKTITVLGILQGALKAEKAMEKHLTELVTDLILNTDVSDKAAAMPKMLKIEETIERDKNAIQILSSAMDLATKTLTVREYKDQLQKTLEEHQSKKRETKHRKDMDMTKLKQEILDHMHHMQRKIATKIDTTLEYLREHRELDAFKVNRKRSAEAGKDLENLFTEDKVENNLVVVDKEDGKDVSIKVDIGVEHVVETDTTVANDTKTANQFEAAGEGKGDDNDDDDDDESGGGIAPGGLVGLIASLSGGEGGSDIGALVGALTGVIGQIFGPGGLDIESLISTGTSLIAGLLAGDKNFGTVLGEYVGTAFDGLSGGGGAENNGKFVGSLLGTIVASLSANPEDDDLPPQPLVFLQNLIKSFKEANNRDGTPEDGGEGAKPQHPGGSDSFGFIKQIVSALVGGVTSLVLNASLGASGGFSQGSASASSASSHPQPHPKHPSW